MLETHDVRTVERLKNWRDKKQLNTNLVDKIMPDIEISVIVPVFNRKNTITTCVEGILNTKYNSYEVLIIDDGSTDGTLHICKQLEYNHSQIRVFSIPNSGVSVARNVGIRNAVGKYILFVDSDDTLCPDALSYISYHVKNNVDLLMFSHVRVQSECALDSIACYETTSSASVSRENNSDIIRWVFEEYNARNNDWFYIWNKVFRADIIYANKLSFVMMSLWEKI